MFFFDLLSREEREAGWALWIQKYDLPKQTEFPVDEGWTGAEIRNCCDNAYALGIPVVEAAKYIVPVFKADPEGISELRKEADGKFVSASYEGFYKLKDEDKDPVMAASRPGESLSGFVIEIPAEDIEGRPDALPKVGKDKSKYDASDSSFDIQTGINYTEFVRR